jgi:hypothetical protein
MKKSFIATAALLLGVFATGAGAGAVNIETVPAKDRAAILQPPPSEKAGPARPAAGKAQSQPADKNLPAKKSDKPS